MTLNKQILTCVAGLWLILSSAFAQTMVEADDLLYVVQSGDTLYEISEQYLQDPKYWRGLAQNAHVNDPVQLQPGQVIRLSIDLLRHERKEVRVAFQRGEALMIEGVVSKPLARGMVLVEGQTIKTGADGFVSLELPDETKLFLSANSVLTIKQFRHVPDVKRDLIEFVLEEGSVETSVTPQEPNSRFRVSTPMMVTGVRGTTFGVSFNSQKHMQTNNVTEGKVAILPNKGQTVTQAQAVGSGVMLNAGQGAVMTAEMTVPQVGDLLPAPDLSAWPQYIHNDVWAPTDFAAEFTFDYVVRVSPKDAPAEVIFESRGALVPIGLFKEDGVYQIQVRALDANGIPGKVAVHTVTVKTKPAAPLLQAPDSGAEIALLREQKLVCTNAPGIRRYSLQIAQDMLFTQMIEEQVSTDGCMFNLKPQQLGHYYWRVASLDGSSADIDAERGKYSTVGDFEVVPVVVVPAVEQEQNGKSIALYWEQVTSGSNYVVQLSEDIGFADVISTHETDQTKITLDISSSCKTLYVRIKSIEPNGVESDFSDPRTLQTAYTWCTRDGLPVIDQQGIPVGVRSSIK